MLNGVKKIALVLFGSLPCNRLVSQLVAASAADELVAASVLPLDLVDNKAPEWITLMPAGKFTATGHGEFNNGQPDAIVAASRARAGSTDLAIDYDHALEHVEKTGGKAIASGWIKELKVDNGAIKARVDWTAAAAQHIAAKEYRYISPVFHHDAQNNVTFIARAGLTNKPAITKLPPIAAAAVNKEDIMDKDAFAKLLVILGLAATATVDQVIAACEGAMAKINLVVSAAGGNLTAAAAGDQLVAAIRANPDKSQWIAASEFNKVTAELGDLKKAGAATAIAAAIDEGLKAGKIAPASKDYWTKICSDAGSPDTLKKFLETAPVILKPGESGAVAAAAAAVVAGATDVKVAASQLTDDEKKVAGQMGVSFESFAATKIGVAPPVKS